MVRAHLLDRRGPHHVLVADRTGAERMARRIRELAPRLVRDAARVLLRLLEVGQRLRPHELEALGRERGADDGLGNEIEERTDARAPELIYDRRWALELLDEMRGICELLDEGQRDRPYITALDVQTAKVRDVSLTPAARTLRELEQRGESFDEFALHMSKMHKAYFLDLYPPNEQRLAEFRREADQSLEAQAAVERADRINFDAYLAQYFAPGRVG